jgi:glutamate 5-kinase
MPPEQRQLPPIRRLVVKIGSAVLAPAGQLDPAAIARLAADAASLTPPRQIVFVSSGAVASGFRALGLDQPPRTIVEKQAAAAVGQQRLMAAWADAFAPHHRPVAQVLLTADDLGHRPRFLNARRTLLELLDRGAVPIINENDSVSFEEIKFGDNDRLSALVCGLVQADLLLMLSSVEGLYAAGQTGRVVPLIHDALEADAHIRTEQSDVGTGGMVTKVQAAAITTAAGVPAVIAGGSVPSIISRILAGEPLGTLFAPAPKATAARKRWIGAAARVRGHITIDPGAAAALTQRGASLLPSGIQSVHGRFESGAVIEIRAPDSTPLARGVTAYASGEIDRLRGKRSADIPAILGYSYADEIIHRNDLVLLPAASLRRTPKPEPAP